MADFRISRSWSEYSVLNRLNFGFASLRSSRGNTGKESVRFISWSGWLGSNLVPDSTNSRIKQSIPPSAHKTQKIHLTNIVIFDSQTTQPHTNYSKNNLLILRIFLITSRVVIWTMLIFFQIHYLKKTVTIISSNLLKCEVLQKICSTFEYQILLNNLSMLIDLWFEESCSQTKIQ